MKKRKVNLKMLALQKQTVANMQYVQGGAPETLGCGPGTSIILNCTTVQEPTRPLITVDRDKEICVTVFNSCKSYCPFC